MVDLHTHSTRSDGTLSPSELVDLAVKKGLTAVALTDHDSVAGLDEAINHAKELSEQGIAVPEIIPGIEFSTEYEGKDIHVVGLFIDYKSGVFADYLKHFVDSRDERNKRMCDMMVADGIDIPYEKLLSECPNSVVTRAHMARYMVEHGIVRDRAAAFDKYIGDHCKYFLSREKVTPEMAIDLILQADGIPVLAHPMLYHLSDKKLDELVARLKKAGLMAIEAIYSTYSASDERHVRGLAQKYHLLLSGGSDFHGANKPGIDLGTGYGKLYLDDEILNKQKLALKNILFTDMDGTLLNSDSNISDSLKYAIDTMIERGHKFVLASGRPINSILERKVNLGFNYPNSYIISYNGGLIYDCESNSIIHMSKLAQDAVREIVKLADEAHIHVHSYTETHIVGYEEDKEIEFYRRRIKMPFMQVSDIAAALPDGALKVQIISLTDKDALKKLAEKINDALGNVAEAFFSNDYYLEVLPKHTDKGTAVRWLTDYLSMPHSHSYAAGDEDNDIPMIKAAGHGIAMQNATEKVKEYADIITVKDNNHDGLLEIINKYFN